MVATKVNVSNNFIPCDILIMNDQEWNKIFDCLKELEHFGFHLTNPISNISQNVLEITYSCYYLDQDNLDCYLRSSVLPFNIIPHEFSQEISMCSFGNGLIEEGNMFIEKSSLVLVQSRGDLKYLNKVQDSFECILKKHDFLIETSEINNGNYYGSGYFSKEYQLNNKKGANV